MQLSIEDLEQRLTPRGHLNPLPQVSVAFIRDGTIQITGTKLDDSVTLSRSYGGRNGYGVPVDLGINVTVNGKTTFYKAESGDAYYRITFDGKAGDDVFQNNTGIRCTARGGDGNDKLY